MAGCSWLWHRAVWPGICPDGDRLPIQLRGRHRAALGREELSAPAPTTQPGSSWGGTGRPPARTELPRMLPAPNPPGPPLARGYRLGWPRGTGEQWGLCRSRVSPQRQA